MKRKRWWRSENFQAAFPWFVGGMVLFLTGLMLVVQIDPMQKFAAAPSPKAGPVAILQFGPHEHGSAVHIGKGFILTAAHVIKGHTTVQITTDRGEELPSEILWSNEQYDVALLLTPAKDKMEARPLSCRKLHVGMAVRALGSPIKERFLTLYGQVSGEAHQDRYKPWRVLVPLGIAVSSGMSGGPLLDNAGNVVGIIAARVVEPTGFIPMPTAIGLAVPASAFCNLLGRR